MSRDQVRSLKRHLHRGRCDTASPLDRDAARASALALLARSLQMGHVRLALLRLRDAALCGAAVTPEQWRTCRQIAMASADLRCLVAFEQARRASQTGHAALSLPASAPTPSRGSSDPTDQVPASHPA